MKLKMPTLDDETLYIDEKLMQKSFDVADLILCDDADTMPAHFLSYLKHIQKKSDLLFVNDTDEEATFNFTQSYLPTKREVQFHKTNPYAKAMHLIASLLKDTDAAEIVVISTQQNREKLQEDLGSFIEDETLLLDASKHLTEQKIDSSILLTTYDNTIELEAKYAILMDLCFEDMQQLSRACNVATKGLYILYEEDSEDIEKLKEKYENNQE
jgi:GTPase involved in cell partitioning and DNA repair